MARLYGPGPGDPPALLATRDLSGLAAKDVEDRPIGELFGALSEKSTGLIRYLDVALSDRPKHVLVPIGHARLESDAPRPACRLRAATYEDLLAVPEYEPDETAVDGAYQDDVLRAHGLLFYGANYYAHPAYEHRQVYAGESAVVDGEPGTEAGAARSRTGLALLSALGGPAARSRARELVGAAVDDVDGDEVGAVTDLLVELAVGQPRYAVLELEGPARRAALPLGFLVVADEERRRLRTPGLSREDILLLPPYEGPPSREEENRLRAALDGRLTGERYFDRPDFRRY